MVHGFVNTTTFVSSSGLLLTANTPIGLIGIAESGAINQIIRVRSGADLAQFGVRTTGTIVRALEILQSYGCNNVYVIRVATGANNTDTITNIIGGETAGVKTGLPLFRDVLSLFREKPEVLIMPTFNTDAVIAQALAVASDLNVDALVISSFTVGTSTATATTTRGTATGLGTKNPRLIPCLPHIRNSQNELNGLGVHLAGLIAKTAVDRGFGFTPSNKALVGATGIESGFTLSYVDANADNQKLEKLGIFSVNSNSNGFVGWGNRNALYVADSNQTLETYINLQRIKQVLNAQFEKVQAYYIDEPCNYGTGKILETALKNVVSQNAARGNLTFQSTVSFNLQRTDYAARRLAYDIYIASDLPTYLIEASIQYTVQM